MEIRKITKTDGNRLFVEISKSMKEQKGLPLLKKGDEVMLMPVRKLSEAQMQKLIGKHIKYFEHNNIFDMSAYIEGILKENHSKYWREVPPEIEISGENPEKSAKYLLIGKEGYSIDFFDNLDKVFDLQILSEKKQFVEKFICVKCKRECFSEYKYCPHCGKKNKLYETWPN